MKMITIAVTGTDVCLGGLHPQHFCCICTEIFNDPQGANHFTSACSIIVYRDELFWGQVLKRVWVLQPRQNLVDDGGDLGDIVIPRSPRSTRSAMPTRLPPRRTHRERCDRRVFRVLL